VDRPTRDPGAADLTADLRTHRSTFRAATQRFGHSAILLPTAEGSLKPG